MPGERQMTIRLDVRDQLSWRNIASHGDWPSKPLITFDAIPGCNYFHPYLYDKKTRKKNSIFSNSNLDLR